MNDIGACHVAERWDGYVAVICGDGNSVGRRFVNTRSAFDLNNKSDEVHEAVDRAISEAIECSISDHQTLEPNGDQLPLNIVVRAGDDVKMIVPAPVGLSAAAGLATGGGDGLQACAGVLICHSNLPFSVAHHHAEELLKQAKRAARSHDLENPPAHVAFAFESGSQVQEGLGQSPISASPYLARHVTHLLRAADRLEASNSALRSVLGELRKGGRLAERAWGRFAMNLNNSDEELLTGLFGELGGSFPRPWIVAGDSSRSPAGDLAALRSLRRGHR